MGIFLFFGATMASLAGATLIWRGTILDRMWALNAPAHRQLAPFGKTVGIPYSCSVQPWQLLARPGSSVALGVATGSCHHRNPSLGRSGERLHG